MNTEIIEALMEGSDIPFIKEENVCEDDTSFNLGNLVIDESAELTIKHEITEGLSECVPTSFENTNITTIIEEVAKIEGDGMELNKDIYSPDTGVLPYCNDIFNTNTETFSVPDSIDPIEIKPEESNQNLSPEPAPVLLLKSSEIQKARQQNNQFFGSKKASNTVKTQTYNPKKVMLLVAPPAKGRLETPRVTLNSYGGSHVNNNGYQKQSGNGYLKQSDMSFDRIGKQLKYLLNTTPNYSKSYVAAAPKVPSSKLVSILRKDIKRKEKFEDFHNYYKTHSDNATTCTDPINVSTTMNYEKSVELIEPSNRYQNLELQEYCDNEIILPEIKQELNDIPLEDSSLINKNFSLTDEMEGLPAHKKLQLPSDLVPRTDGVERNVKQSYIQVLMNKSSTGNTNENNGESCVKENNVKVNLNFNKWFKCSKCKTICVGYKSCPRKECNKGEDGSSNNDKSESEEFEKTNVPKTTTVSVSKLDPKCFGCGRIFSNKHEYQLHIQKGCLKYSTKEKFYNCKTCNTFYVGQDSCSKLKCKEKLIKKTGESLSMFSDYKCGFCNSMFKTLDQYETHVENSDCSKKNDGVSIIDLDVSSIGEKNGDKTESAETVREAIDKSLAETFSKHSGFSASKGDYDHTSIPNKYKCAFCDRNFSSIYQYKNHLKLHEPSHSCNICGQVFDKSLYLKRHMIIHEPSEYPCEMCDKVFAKACYLRKHMVTHSEDKPYVCSECGKGFKFDSNRYEHMKIHTGVRNYVCEICGHTSINSSHLKIHMRSHTGERPYKCKHCGKAFATTSNLSKHVVIHSNQRPFKCDYCHIAFRIADHLSRHMMKHTNARPFICDLCGKSFRRTCHLKRHKETMHLNAHTARTCRKIKQKLRKRRKRKT